MARRGQVRGGTGRSRRLIGNGFDERRGFARVSFDIRCRGFSRCFGVRGFDEGHVELQDRLQVGFGRPVRNAALDGHLRGRRLRELVDQCKLGRCLAGNRRLFVVRCRPIRWARDRLVHRFGCSRLRQLRYNVPDVHALRGARRDQRNQADIRAGTDALQHHVADADRRLDAALHQRVVARCLQAGLGEIAKAEQRTRGVAGADKHAVARECGDRRIDAFDQALQSFDQRHRAACGFGGRNQECRRRHRKNPAARRRRSPGCRAKHQSRAAAPAASRRSAAAVRRAAPPDADADRRGRRFSPPEPWHWPHQKALRRPGWPKESACHLVTTAMPATGCRHEPPASDRHHPATGIPHRSSALHD